MDSQKQSDKTIFQGALDFESRQARLDYVADACSTDSAQLSRVISLLEGLERDSSFLEKALPDLIFSNPDNRLEESVGSQIGHYKLREQIGVGGMGIVFVAEQTSPVSRIVALKVIKPGIDSKEVIARFEAERQALALMDHPNIAKVLEAGCTASGRPYFVMELVRGLPITKYCDEYKLNTNERLRIFTKVCNAVQHAHQKGIIHRDLKPGNILVTRDGNQGIPKVIDFGVAKAINRRLTEKTIYTRYSQMIGTPMYMSPEQAELSDLDTDTRTDVYSLGVVLYELLTGRTPFKKSELHSAGFDEMRRIIREVDPPCPSDRVSTLNAEALSTVCGNRSCDVGQIKNRLRGELDWIVMKAIEKDRSRRYESTNSLAADVQRYLADEPVEACPPSALYLFKKTVRKNRFAIGTVGLVAVALILGFIGTSWQAIQATRERNQKRTALDKLTVALSEKNDALSVASANLSAATAESRRALANLKLAMQTVDAVYLNSIGESSPYRQQFDWALMPGDETSLMTRIPLDERSDFSTADRELLSKGLVFYEKISQQNPSSDEARFETAQALVRVAQIQFSMRQPFEARIACQRAIQLLQQLISHEPENSNFILAWGEASYHHGQFTLSLLMSRSFAPRSPYTSMSLGKMRTFHLRCFFVVGLISLWLTRFKGTHDRSGFPAAVLK